MKKPNLCHECKRKRILSGMRNAKAKGKVIGRVRKRNSVLIESLLEAQLSYREIARIAKCSHGSVHAQYREKNDGGRSGAITPLMATSFIDSKKPGMMEPPH